MERLPGTLKEFDDRYTAPVSGFASVDDYYARCSSSQFLGHVSIPTTILTARDDPLIPIRMFESADFSSSIVLHAAAGGGHLGYIGRRGIDPDRRWMDWRVVDWVTHDSIAGNNG